VEPVKPEVLGRFLPRWQGLSPHRRGLDALLDAVEKLQGLPLPASVVESEILPARVDGFTSQDVDALAAAGELTWAGIEPLGERDGRVALYLTDALPRLWFPPQLDDTALSARQRALLTALAKGGQFFPALHAAAGGGHVQETVDALWGLVWLGAVTNDAWRPLRAFLRPRPGHDRQPSPRRLFRSRRQTPPTAEGRWSLVLDRVTQRPSPTEQAATLAHQLLQRYGAVVPAYAYGTVLPWPMRGPARVAGASVVLVDGALAAYLRRGSHQLLVFLPSEEPEQSRAARALAEQLVRHARRADARQKGWAEPGRLARDGLLMGGVRNFV
jgi:ATP-dependent Lhr-like helicase